MVKDVFFSEVNQYFDGLMREMVRHIVGVQFRNGATVGGSLYGRYGFSDVLTALLVLDTEVELYKAGRISLTEYANMPYDNDILVRIIIKKDGRKAAYVTQRRTETDFPLIAVAAAKKDDTWYTAVGARPARASLVTEADQGSAEELAEKIADQYRYGTNLRGSAEYRKALAQIYIRRLVDEIRTKEEGGLQ